MFSLVSCNGSCNTRYDLSDRLCVWSKAEDRYLKVFDMITGIMNKYSKTYLMWS